VGASSASPAGSPISLYIPQESSAFRCNPLAVTAFILKSNNLYGMSLK